jgi:N-methylhydantoinase B/oxoprolinase/acetone carboxylase alpha subunit
VWLPRDSVLRICTPSGGGYGKAKERDAAAAEADVREGRVGG